MTDTFFISGESAVQRLLGRPGTCLLLRVPAMLSPVLTSSRWIKFEEKVEEGGERWSKPHVSTLSLHSLFELRTCLQTGTVLLDLDSGSLPQIIGEARASLLWSPQMRQFPISCPHASPYDWPIQPLPDSAEMSLILKLSRQGPRCPDFHTAQTSSR